MNYDTQKEKDWLNKKIEYNNTWDGSQQWKTELQDVLDKNLAAHGFKQILVPVKLEPNACDILFKQENARLARLFSNIIDIFDELPYRPDVAFDLCWRSFEILLSYIMKQKNKDTDEQNEEDSEKGKKKKKKPNTTDDLKNISLEIADLASSNSLIRECLDNLITAHSLSALKYCLNYLSVLYAPDETIPDDFNLMFEPESNNIKFRFEQALNQEKEYEPDKKAHLFDMFVKQYFNDEYYGKVNSKDYTAYQTISKAALCLRKIINGDSIKLKYTPKDAEPLEVAFDSLEMSKRIEFVLGVVLYTIRNNRFHGDNTPLFKSSASNASTYYSMYYCLIATYGMFWILLHKHLKDNSLDEFVTIDSICKSINESLDRLKTTLTNK